MIIIDPDGKLKKVLRAHTYYSIRIGTLYEEHNCTCRKQFTNYDKFLNHLIEMIRTDNL